MVRRMRTEPPICPYHFIRHLSRRHVDKTSGIFETSEVFHYHSGDLIKWVEPSCAWDKNSYFCGKAVKVF